MRNLSCQWQKVVKTGTQLDYLSIDQDCNYVYGCFNNIIVKLDYNTQQVLLEHRLPDEEIQLSDIHWLPSHRALFVVVNVTTLALFHPDSLTLEEMAVIEDGVSCAEWSPDDGVCVVVTGAGKLILMSEEFDPIKDTDVRPQDFGSEHQTQVGWGSKETQFHGSAGKGASQQPVFATPTPIATTDSQETRVSWRGDGQYFVVSTIDQRDSEFYRVVRMWTREGVHTATNEPVPGLEDSISWRPSGNLISTTVNHNNQHQVIFMERNGLRHGEFPLTLRAENTCVSTTTWNSSSNVLAVIYEGQEQCHVMLYTCSNYCWQLKQHYTYNTSNITFIWDHEDEHKFHVSVDSRYICYQLTSKVSTCSSTTTMVIDDKKVNTTPMSTMCIPPPMSYSQLITDSTCNSISCHGDDAWLLCSDRTIHRFNNVSHAPPGEITPDESYTIEREFPLDSHTCIRHLVMVTQSKAYCVALVNDVDALLTLELSDKEVFVVSCTTLEDTVVNMMKHPGSTTIVVQLYSGELFELHGGMLEPWGSVDMRECARFCEMEIAVFEEEMVVIGRTSFNHLYMDTRLWNYDCTSISLHKTHLLLTSHSHTLMCVSLSQPAHVARTTEGVVDTGIRSIERGSRLVVSDPDSSRVILQMPRGNLELIHPRPLLLTHLAQLIDTFQYKKVFESVRKHRVNMNFILDYHPEQFLTKLPDILSKLNSQFMELFIAELSSEDTTLTMYSFMGTQSTAPSTDKINTVCNAVLDAVSTTDTVPWLNTLISCYVKIDNVSAGLQKLKSLYHTHPAETEAAIKYMLILTDDEALFNHALGTHDLDLVLLVAQHTQKDPKEYMLFLNELQEHDELYRKFKIDEHLGRNKTALHFLMCCEGRFEEVCNYVTKHNLHSTALQHYQFGTDQYKTIGRMFALSLKENRQMEEAGVLFGQCAELKECLECLRFTKQSHLALSVGAQLNLPPDQMSGLAEQLAGNLRRDGGHREAARLYDRYCDNPDEAVEVLCEGGLYSDALEVSQSRNRVDLISNIMSSLKVESEQTFNLLEEKRELAEKLASRIVVVREKRSQVGTGFEDMDHSDLYSDTTSITATSHTGSTSSRRSAKSAKGRKKAEMKKYSLKEGSKYEYFAIQEAFKGIITFINLRSAMIKDMVNILLLQGLLESARKVVNAHQQVVEVVNKNVNVIWPPPQSDVVEREGEVEPISYPPEKIKISAVELKQFTGC